MRSFFDRRAKRLAKLVADGNDDGALQAELRSATAEEIALVLRSMPVERANAVLSGVPAAAIKAALEHLGNTPAAPRARASEPVCMRALDFAGRVFGRPEPADD